MGFSQFKEPKGDPGAFGGPRESDVRAAASDLRRPLTFDLRHVSELAGAHLQHGPGIPLQPEGPGVSGRPQERHSRRPSRGVKRPTAPTFAIATKELHLPCSESGTGRVVPSPCFN